MAHLREASLRATLALGLGCVNARSRRFVTPAKIYFAKRRTLYEIGRPTTIKIQNDIAGEVTKALKVSIAAPPENKPHA